MALHFTLMGEYCACFINDNKVLFFPELISIKGGVKNQVQNMTVIIYMNN